ncbi:MAG TPA: TonB-dependent receptor [Saprospiraceae bacterium]|mgnify:FL=1|nr:TonB-dependent receptor [Saprospiraceae bacterium]
MKLLNTLLLIGCLHTMHAQTAAVKGFLKSPEGEAVSFAQVALFNAADSTLAKAVLSNETGVFDIGGLRAGHYFLKATYLGMQDLRKNDIAVSEGRQLDLGAISFVGSTISLTETIVSAARPLIEVKPDRLVFNVTGTINSAGTDALSLLRKAPSVTVDNNDNLSVLGRAGVLLYVDGKRLPLSGQDLTNYLQSLPADQIDRFDIISNPGAKYEAEGNAGIIDIRLKKDKNLGANGSINGTFSQGRYHRENLSGNGNYRNKRFNIFGTAGANEGIWFDDMRFYSFLNGIVQDEINNNRNAFMGYNYRVGADYFLAKNHTLGFLTSGGTNHWDRSGYNRITLAQESMPAQIDSILIAGNTADVQRTNRTYNLNYRFDNTKGRSFNLDLDYGNYQNSTQRLQPNRYYDATETILKTEILTSFDTPSDIDIYTAQADYEDDLWGGKLGIGSKMSKVVSDNTFLFFDEADGVITRNDSFSNRFNYDEQVFAGYLSYARGFGEKFNLSAGIRAEHTDAAGNLQAFLPELQEPPVLLNYWSWFPNVGVTYQLSQKHSLGINAGRRINRPDYNVLNPFNNRMSELSYEKGNPFLRPEIVNNIELGLTLAQRYNFKLGYSRTQDQITRLIAPDDDDPRAGFITWANLADQSIISFNASAPVQILKKWHAYFNASASHLDNQADYGDGAVVDLQAFTYSIYQQHTFDLPWKLKGEISGYYSGPGIWGGVFVYESSWSLDVGLQRKFMHDRLNVRLSASDLFYESGWNGVSDFDGLKSYGLGRNDSRRVSLSLGYRFGNENVKSRKRETSMEAEQNRVGG